VKKIKEGKKQAEVLSEKRKKTNEKNVCVCRSMLHKVRSREIA